jgi:hypothetical protein
VPNSAPDDSPIAFTPLMVPDPAGRRAHGRRRALLAGIAAVVVVAGGITWWAVAANSGGGSKPGKHTAVIPAAFGAYTEAKAGDTDWTGLSSVNTDITKGEVHLTYRAPGDEAANISITLDPPAGSDGGSAPSDDALSQLTGTTVDSGASTTHPAGKHGGKITCTDIAVDKAHSFTGCEWQDKTASVLYFPVLKHHTVVATDAPTNFRAFLDALTIEPKKN